jgi:hypothetical protein
MYAAMSHGPLPPPEVVREMSSNAIQPQAVAGALEAARATCTTAPAPTEKVQLNCCHEVVLVTGVAQYRPVNTPQSA